MNNRVHLFALGLLVLTACSTTTRHIPSTQPIAVTVPYDMNGERTAWVDLHPSTPFHVLLTNVSEKSVRLWQEWCSWGYYSLHFEIMGPDGQEHVLKKKPTAFYGNFPSWLVLEPGDSAVWVVEFDSSVWEDLSWVPTDRSAKCRLKAVYSVKSDEDSKRHSVWTGKVVSSVYDIPVRRAAPVEGK